MSTTDDNQVFVASCAKADKYPLNLRQQASNDGSLLAERSLLLDVGANIFRLSSRLVTLSLSKTLQGKNTVALQTHQTDDDFNKWLVQPQSDGSTAMSATRCRFLFFQAPSMRSKLELTLAHAKHILSYFQVMPSFIDFIAVFAVRKEDENDGVDLRFSSFKQRTHLSLASRGLDLPHLALGGHGYQLNYNLKCVTNTTKESSRNWPLVTNDIEKWSWSVRQAVVHHQFDVAEGTTLWLMAAGRDHLQKRVQRLVGQESRTLLVANLTNGNAPTTSSGNDDGLEPREADRSFTNAETSFIAGLSVHIMMVQYASEDWRGYLTWLEQMLQKKTKSAIDNLDYDPDTFQLIDTQMLEDRVNKAAMFLNANAKVVQSLHDFYSSLIKNKLFDLRNELRCVEATTTFLSQLQEYLYDIKMLSERATVLSKLAEDRKNLVQSRLQIRATARVEKLTIEQQREAKIMRVIAVGTLIYLPATFVSTFFSTDVVKYQPSRDDNSNSTDTTSYSPIAMERWIEVTVPLTVMTLLFAGIWYSYWRPLKLKVMKWWRAQPLRDAEKDG